MNFHLPLVTCLLLGTALATPVSKLPSEWFIPSANSPNSFTLVDEMTGTIRVGTMSNAGAVSWSASIPTGISSVADVAGGLPGNFGEIVALTSPVCNRVGLVEVDSPSPFLTLLSGMSGIGPCGLAAIGTAPALELWVASASNGASPGMLEVHDSLATGGTQRASSSFNQSFRRLQPLFAPGSSKSIALYSETLGTQTRLGLAYRSGAAVVQ
jgi:hypothetical protein